MGTENEKKVRKFNIVDIIIILVVIAAVAIVLYKTAGKKIVESVSTKEYYVTFTVNEVSNSTVNAVKEGDPAVDNAGNNYLGTVYNKVVDPKSHTCAVNDEGEFLENGKPGFCYLELTVKVNAVKNNNGISINGTNYLVGHTMTLEAGDAKLYVLVSGISETAPERGKAEDTAIIGGVDTAEVVTEKATVSDGE